MNNSKMRSIAGTAAIALMLVGVNFVFATTEQAATSKVNSIKLQGSGAKITWTVDGTSAQGYKVVWSKNTDPVYPNREGDQYHYFSDPSTKYDSLEAFSGNGDYYVRVCEYLGGKCGVYSNQIKLTLGGSETGPVACTMEYAPVCGEQVVYCIKAPCPPVKTTYGNKCSMVAAKAKFLYSGECKKEEVVKKDYTAKDYKAMITRLEQKVQKLEKENRRLYKLIKLREAEIEALKE
jgi:hypothetical protein